MDVEEQVFPCWEKAGCQSASNRRAAPALVPVANALGADPKPFSMGCSRPAPRSAEGLKWKQVSELLF